MNRELVLAGSAAVVSLVLLVGALAVPGILATPEPEPPDPARISVVDLPVTVGEVGGASATIDLAAHLRHEGGPAENVTVRLRAVDTDTGFVVARTERDVGTVAVTGERVVPLSLTVPREGAYEFELVVYGDGQRVTTADLTVDGVGTLEPAYERTNLTFREFDATGIPAVEYSIEGTDPATNRTTLGVSAYVTNAGGDDAGAVELVVKARQVDSGIVADQARVEVGTVRPGRTVSPEVALTVPDGYNYYLDAFLVRDGVIVDTARAGATLNPVREVPANTTTEAVGIDVGDFDEQEATQTRTEAPMTTTAASPGFGVGVAIVALGGAALLARRRSA